MLLILLKKYKRPVLWGLSAALACVVSFQYGMKFKKPVILEKVKTETVEVEVVKFVEIEKIVKDQKVKEVKKIIEKPDGTKETTITKTSETKSEKSTSKNTNKKTDVATKTQKSQSVAPEPTKYSVGAVAHKEYKNLLKPETYKRTDFSVTAGYRVIGDVWLDSGFRINQKTQLEEVSVGIRWEF